MTRLIADSGSTKTDWVAIDQKGVVSRFSGSGYNPYYMSSEEIGRDIAANFPDGVDTKNIWRIDFYGAGVRPAQKQGMVRALSEAFPSAREISAESDTLGAARALLGRSKGFASILGTGMNTCLCENGEIVMNVPSLGYILGDEGSGAFMGKRLLRDWLRGQMPASALEKTSKVIGLTIDEVLSKMYKETYPNRWCAGLVRFIAENIEEKYFRNLVEGSFRELFDKVVTHYPDFRAYEFNCCGSVGYVFRDILSETASNYGMRPGTFLKEPLEGLILQALNEMSE